MMGVTFLFGSSVNDGEDEDDALADQQQLDLIVVLLTSVILGVMILTTVIGGTSCGP